MNLYPNRLTAALPAVAEARGWNPRAAAVAFLRLSLAGVFLLAVLPKLAHPLDFLGTVYSYELVGRGGAHLVAALVPAAELAVVVALVSGVALRAGALAATLLLAGFAVGIASVLFRDLAIDCGCFAFSKEDVVSRWTLGRTLGLTLMAGVLFALLRPRGESSRVVSPTRVRLRPRRGGFSLPELVVVLGILLLLLALLLPTLRAARESGRRTFCASNLRQQTALMSAYASDNGFWMIRGRRGESPESQWKLNIAKAAGLWEGGDDDAAYDAGVLVLRQASLFNCPSHPMLGNIPGTYAINAFNAADRKRSPKGSGPITRVRNASEVVWLAELVNDQWAGTGTVGGVPPIYFPEFHTVRGSGDLPGTAGSVITDTRHIRDANFAYFDGSVKPIPEGQVRLRMFFDGEQ